MRHCLVILLIGLAMFNSLQTAQMDTDQNAKSLFGHTINEDLYWEALIQLANGDKEAALQIIALIKNENPATRNHPWKESLPENINTFFDKLFIDSIRNNPQLLSQLKLFESIGIRNHNAHLTDISVQAVIHNLEITKTNLLRLNNYPLEKLSHDQRISHKIFSWTLNHAVDGERFLFHTYKISQLEGVLANLSVLLTQFHILETKEDVENYISRLSKIPEHFQQAIAFMELQKNNGIIPPRFTIEKVISIIKKSIPEQINKNIFYLNLEEQLHKIRCENSDAILKKALIVIADAVYPAYKNLQNYFTQLLEHAQTNNGVWALPDGDAYYAYMLRYHTTSDLSADEIHELGLLEVAKIHEEIQKILSAEQIVDSTKSVGVLIQELEKNPQFYYPNTQAGRAQCLADYETILERSRKELGHLFDLKPQAGVTIQRVPPHEEEGAPGAYYWGPSVDGSRSGTFFANLRDMNEEPKYRMETLTIHEAEPGHHFQIALQYEMKIPMLRKLGDYNAYCEGWALYTEKLAYEHNFYSSSFAQLGHLQDELLRAARLVIDTGIHHKRWSREQAIAYMQEVTGYNYNTVISEVERYFVLPGQACSYKIGQLKILALRQQAQERLGEKFNIREFHNEILRLGPAPLIVLEEVICHYIDNKRAA